MYLSGSKLSLLALNSTGSVEAGNPPGHVPNDGMQPVLGSTVALQRLPFTLPDQTGSPVASRCGASTVTACRP